MLKLKLQTEKKSYLLYLFHTGSTAGNRYWHMLSEMLYIRTDSYCCYNFFFLSRIHNLLLSGVSGGSRILHKFSAAPVEFMGENIEGNEMCQQTPGWNIVCAQKGSFCCRTN